MVSGVPIEEGGEYFQGSPAAKRLTITFWTNTAPESRPGSSSRACPVCLVYEATPSAPVGAASMLPEPVVLINPACSVDNLLFQDLRVARWERSGGQGSAHTFKTIFLCFHGTSGLTMVLGLVPSVCELWSSFAPHALPPLSCRRALILPVSHGTGSRAQGGRLDSCLH